MNDVLVDSSVWINYFKYRDAFPFMDDLIDDGRICTNDVILTELLPSIAYKKEFALANLLKSLCKYDMNINWQELQLYQLLSIKNGNNNAIAATAAAKRKPFVLLIIDLLLGLSLLYFPYRTGDYP